MKKNVARYGVLIALAFIFSYVEAQIPFEVLLGLPGIKLGLANLVIVVALYTMKLRDALLISLVRVFLVGFTFGNLSMAIYSLCGGLLSFGVMALLKKLDWFGVMGVSLAGGIFHNIGQLVVAVLIMENVKIAYYFPPLMIAGAITGAAIGIVADIIMARLRRVM